MKKLVKKIDKQILLRNTIILLFTLSIFIAIDQFTKVALFAQIKGSDHDKIGHEQLMFPTGGSIVGTRLVTNTGMFSSLGADSVPYWGVQTITSLVAIMVILASLFSKKSLVSFGFALIAAGALGNILDRYMLTFVASDGEIKHYVRDWIYHPNFDRGTYNLADVEVMAGSIVTALSIIFNLFKEEKNKEKINTKKKTN